jgi:DHA3 family tetracycline resistance protein-like MFS transporter
MGVYRIQTVGMNPLALVLAGTFLELSCLLFEIPTGVVADAYSRRLSVIIAFVLLGVSIVVQGFLPYVFVVLAMEVVSGIGYTFSSGALDAWITDEIGEEKVARVFLRSGQLDHACDIAATLCGVGLASAFSLNVPILVSGVLFVLLAGFLVLFMPEHGYKPLPASERSSWHAMATTWREAYRVVRSRHAGWAILGIGIVFGLYSEGVDRLWEAHFLTNFVFPGLGALQPIVWFGILRTGTALLSIIAAEVLARRVSAQTNRRLAPILLVLTGCLAVGLVAFASASGFWWAVVAYWLIGTTRSMMYPLYRAWLNRSVPSSVRATVLSVSSQMDAFGQFAGGPAIGLVGNLRGLRAAILTAAAFLSPALPLFGFVLRGREPVLPGDEQAVED